MINIMIKSLLKNFNVDIGYNQLIINNKDLFRKLYFNFEEEVILDIEDVELSNVNYLKVPNILDVDLNEKKSITILYKFLDKYINNNFKDNKMILTNQISDFIDEVIDSVEEKVEYDLEIDNTKLFQAINLKHYINPENFIESIIDYLKTNLDKKIKLFIIYNGSNVLSKKELKLLDEELKINQLIILDVTTSNYDYNSKLIVDEDLCIL